MNLRLLLLEDDRDLRATLQQALEVEGYHVQPSASLADALALIRNAQNPPDMVLLDLGLPDGDGETALEAIRLHSSAPVIVISARPDERSRVRLLDQGADDYLVKPFGLAELLARMRVAWRHRGTTVRPAITQYRRVDLLVDLAQRTVLRDAQPVHLTPTEFQLLSRLVRQAGQVVTHRQLLMDVWGPEFTEHTHYLRLYMAQLRSKLEFDPKEPTIFLTEPGVGYRLAEPLD